MLYYTKYKSPIGMLTIVGDQDSIIGLWIEGQKYDLENIDEPLILKDDLKHFQKVKQWLSKYFQGIDEKIDVLLKPKGSKFQQKVWKILTTIPYGTTTTYGTIATILAEEEKRTTIPYRAVGKAISHNPISILIPCHRVIGKTGKLTGYAGGLEKKKQLLEIEKHAKEI